LKPLPAGEGFIIMAAEDVRPNIRRGAMKRKTRKKSSRPVLRFLLWTAVFLLLAVAADQVLLHLSVDQPLLRNFQVCYKDFRTRLLKTPATTTPKAVPQRTARPSTSRPSTARKGTVLPKTVEAAIEREAGSSAPSTGSYLYVDGEGTLQFADSLEEVPSAYRSKAQPMAE
jgi:hypothetical protein